MPTEPTDDNPVWIQELNEVEKSTQAIPTAGSLFLDKYFDVDTSDADEGELSPNETSCSDEQEKKMKSLKKNIKELADRVDALEETAWLDVPEGEDPVGTLLSRIALKDKKRTFKLIYGIVKEYAGSQNADPARIPVLFRELFEMCVTGDVRKKD